MNLSPKLKTAWGEHGTWVILLTSFGMGLVLSRPPSWVTAPTLLGLCAFAVAKVMAVRVRRREAGAALLLALAGLACLGLVPVLVRAPVFVVGLGGVGLPFFALYLYEAREPRWTRRLPVEFAGAALLSGAAGLAVLASRPTALSDALWATAAAAALFLPGMLRARLLKESGWALRLSLVGLACLGAGTFWALVHDGVVAPWGMLAALVFVGDLRAFWVVPRVSARHLGVTLTLRSAPAALLVALAWRAF